MSSSIKIAIVAALERELHPLIRLWSVVEKEYAGRTFRFFEQGPMIVVCGGIGTEPARRSAEAVIALYAPEIVCSAGFAGALDAGLKVGDIVLPARVIDSGDCSVTKTDILGASPRGGVLVTFGAVATAEQKVKLGKSFSAQVIDMEAAAVARAAAARGVRFAAVKVISDEVGFQIPGTGEENFVASSGEFRVGRFAGFIAIRPWTWAAAMRLARNSKRAAVALSSWLKENQQTLLNTQESGSLP